MMLAFPSGQSVSKKCRARFPLLQKQTRVPFATFIVSDTSSPRMAGQDADEYALDELTCPITGEIYVDPVLCVGDGHTYERHAAERWLANHTTSPLTGESLPPEGMALVDNHLVRKQAAAVLERRPELRSTVPPHLDNDATPSAPPLQPEFEELEQGDEHQKKKHVEKHENENATVDSPRGVSSRVPYVCIAGLNSSSSSNNNTNSSIGVFSVRPPLPAPRWENVTAGDGGGFLAASDDGSVLASCSLNSSVVTAWRPSYGQTVTGESTQSCSIASVSADDWVLCGAVCPNATWVCAAGRGKFLHMWKVDSDTDNTNGVSFSAHEKIKTVPTDDAPWHKDFATCLSALGHTGVVYGTQDWSARLVTFGDGKSKSSSRLLGRLSAEPTSVSHSNTLVCFGAEDGTVRVFDVRQGERPVVDLKDHLEGPSEYDEESTASTAALALGHDCNFLLHGSAQGSWIREGPRGGWRVRKELNRGITACASMPHASGSEWNSKAVVGVPGVGTVLLNTETGEFSDVSSSDVSSSVCAFSAVNVPESPTPDSDVGKANTKGWFGRVFGQNLGVQNTARTNVRLEDRI